MSQKWVSAVVLLMLGCSRQAREGSEAGTSSSPLREVVFEGTCDASGAVPLGGGLLVVADDEDNVLRVYDARTGGAPLRSVNLSPSLGLEQKKRPPEVDIEAATRFGELALWMGSHGRSSSGKPQPSRLRFFATTAPANGEGITLVGTPTSRLLEDLLADPRYARFGLQQASELPPKTVGGLNIEGMTAMADGGGVLIGFRSPVPEGRALLVPLLNPRELAQGEPARFGDPMQLDLQGLGIRSLSWWRGRYLIIAGGTAGEAVSRLFSWKGGAEAPVPVPGVDLSGLNPEAFFTDEAQEEVLVISDDGSRVRGGVECKRLKDAAQKHFRAVWVKP